MKDDGGINSTRATGGGKAGGFSDRNGMDGNAPLRSAKAPSLPANDALAVKQALLAEKTSKQYAQASLLYLRANALADVPRLMEESQAALKDGRIVAHGPTAEVLTPDLVRRVFDVGARITATADGPLIDLVG